MSIPTKAERTFRGPGPDARCLKPFAHPWGRCRLPGGLAERAIGAGRSVRPSRTAARAWMRLAGYLRANRMARMAAAEREGAGAESLFPAPLGGPGSPGGASLPVRDRHRARTRRKPVPAPGRATRGPRILELAEAFDSVRRTLGLRQHPTPGRVRLGARQEIWMVG